MLKEKIENILNPLKIKKLQEDFKKSKNSFATKVIKKGNDFIIVDLSKEINKNDIIFFQEINGNIEKAVTVCKGKNGITGYNKSGDKVKVRYSEILNWKNRK